MKETWIKCSDRLPPDGIRVDTKIDDNNGVRNEAKLTLVNRLWFLDDGTYIYYAPTHWKFYTTE